MNIVLLYTNKKLEFVDISRKTDFYSLTDKYTVLPKGHGDLIDRDALIFNADYYEPLISKRDVDFAPIIIEADKE